MVERKQSPVAGKRKKGEDKKSETDKPDPSTSAITNGIVKEIRTPSGLPVSKVVVHPLVLLSVVDHFYRVSRGENVNRVVGILLGSQRENKVIDVSNSFAVPFDESDPKVWFLDHEYLEHMYGMFKKVNAREKIVGWYHTGPKLNPNDISINQMIKQYAPNSVLVIVDVQLKKDTDLPTEAYIEIEEVHDNFIYMMFNWLASWMELLPFAHLNTSVVKWEPKKLRKWVLNTSCDLSKNVNVILSLHKRTHNMERPELSDNFGIDIKDQTAGTLSQRITDKYTGVRGMLQNLIHVEEYLKQVADGKLPVNHSLNYLLQDLLNLIYDTFGPDFVRSGNVQLNDDMLAIYLASLARSIISLNNLINNKISLREAEKADTDKSKEDPTKKDELSVTVGDKKKNGETNKGSNFAKKTDKK